MYNPESIFKSAVGLGLISIASILMVFTLKPLYKNTGIDTKVASLCVEKMEQGLSISDLPVPSQKLLIVQGVNCLKSAPNIDVENSDKYQTLFATSEAIISQTELENQAIQGLMINLNSIQADLESMSEYQGVNMVMDYLLVISIGMLILVICTIILVSIEYNISWY